jgi:hypothetical protein
VNFEVEFHLPKFRDAISVAVGKGVSTSFWLDTGLALLPFGVPGRAAETPSPSPVNGTLSGAPRCCLGSSFLSSSCPE